MNPDVNEVLVPLWYRNGSRCLELVEDVGGAGIIKGLQHLFVDCLQLHQSGFVWYQARSSVIDVGDVYVEPCPAFLDLSCCGI